MADSRLGPAFQSERMALIQEIARNLVGESFPTTGARSAATATSSALPANVAAEADVAGADGVLFAGRLAVGAATSPSVASLLAGMKLPQATFAQSDAYRQALAQFAASEPALAAMIQDTPSPDMGVTSTPSPSMEAMSARLPTQSMEALDTAFPNEPATTDVGSLPGEVASETDRAPADTMTFETDTEPRPSSGRRGEPAATAGFGGATIVDAAFASIEAPFSDARASIEAVVERALLGLGIEDGAASATAMRSEMGGIIASFILNAHFLPGWPPLRPVQDPEAKAFVAQLAKDAKLSKDDIAMLTYLANFGLNRSQLARILKLVASATNRSKLLEALTQLLANISAALGAVHAEIEALAEEIKEAGRVRRERIPLR